MKVSFDGFRAEMSREVRELRDIVDEIVSEGTYDEQELEDAMNEVICSMNSLCCFYSETGEFNDIGNIALVGSESCSEE